MCVCPSEEGKCAVGAAVFLMKYIKTSVYAGRYKIYTRIMRGEECQCGNFLNELNFNQKQDGSYIIQSAMKYKAF